jgi:predicted nucleotidyltransferase
MKLAELRQKVGPVCAENDVEMLGVFGSIARGEADDTSDVDLLIRFRKPVGMFDLIELEQRFASLLARPVDLGTEASLHPLIKANVQNDLKVLYEA